MNSSHYFILFSNCKIVKGFKRAILCDLQNEIFYILTSDMVAILEEERSKSIADLYFEYGEENKEILNEYFDYFIENNWIHITSKKNLKLFPKLNLDWQSPSKITNAIVDIDKSSEIDLQNIFKDLISFMCKDIQIRVFDNSYKTILNTIGKLLENTIVRSIEIILPYIDEFTNEWLVDYFIKNSRVVSIIIYNSPEHKVLGNFDVFEPIKCITENIDSEKSCGCVNQSYFACNLRHFTESINFNSCVNCKISVDRKGNIKNCPSMKESFGNISDTTLKEAFAKPGFKKLWNINKDTIKICQDCEFRHICTDCRAYLEDPDNIYSKPLKCGYDPYTGEWAEWSNNPLKAKAIEYYGLN